MSQFPIIHRLSDLLPHIYKNEQIRVKQDETTGLTIACYMVQDEDTFAGNAVEYERECRGIVFDEHGEIVCRTLHKFFNVGEREDTQPHNLPWSDVTRIMEKRDGSMVTPVPFEGFYKFKTKKSFSTKEAALADQISRDVPFGDTWIMELLDRGLTPTFEVTTPKFPIVIKYEKDELTLLHVRENRSGRYLTEEELQQLDCPFPIVENLIEEFSWSMADAGVPYTSEVDWERLKNATSERTGIEGWVIQFKNGEMVKLKTAWYCELHHAVTFTRWRDVARTVVADQADDLKGAFTLTGRSIEPILQVERTIKDRLSTAQQEVHAAVNAGRAANMDVKSMALQHKEHEMFGLIMRLFRGQEVNWMEWYEKNHLDADWSLEVIV